ncbi:hypothetical protein pb186bvf_009995 [Paramecium bursaria]
MINLNDQIMFQIKRNKYIYLKPNYFKSNLNVFPQFSHRVLYDDVTLFFMAKNTNRSNWERTSQAYFLKTQVLYKIRAHLEQD